MIHKIECVQVHYYTFFKRVGNEQAIHDGAGNQNLDDACEKGASEADRRIRHVPGFCAFDHRCDANRRLP